MLLDAVLTPFIAKSPMAVAVRGALEYALDPIDPDAAFDRTAGPWSDRLLLFPTLVDRVATVVGRFHPSVHAALFVRENLVDRNARFRNTAIGTLLVDRADGMDMEQAVKAFETKVAPMNSKRPTSVITQKLVEQAVQNLTDLGLGGAIYRRYAGLSDVSVNDVLFVDNDTRAKMKGGISGPEPRHGHHDFGRRVRPGRVADGHGRGPVPEEPARRQFRQPDGGDGGTGCSSGTTPSRGRTTAT